MHFTTTGHDHGSKMTKLAIVGLMHVALGAVVLDSINKRPASMQKLDAVIDLVPVFVAPKPPPKETVTPKPKVKPPISIPKPEVEPLPTVEDPIVAEVVDEPAPVDEGPSEPVAPAAEDSGSSGGMRNAVLAQGCATPEYPARAARNGDTGTVRLALLVGADGRVNNARVASSSGSRDLDRAALNALSQCRFQPAVANGQPQEGWAQIEYVWRLED